MRTRVTMGVTTALALVVLGSFTATGQDYYKSSAVNGAGAVPAGITINSPSGFISGSNSMSSVGIQVLGGSAFYVSSDKAFIATAVTATICTTPIVTGNNTAAFSINVGSACAGSTGTITYPAATNAWVVSCFDVTTPASFVIGQTGGTTTTATITNYSRTTGAAINFVSSEVLRCQATGF